MANHETRGLRGTRHGASLMLHPLALMIAAAAMIAGPVPGAAPGPGRAGPGPTAMQRRDSGPCCQHLLQRMGDEVGPAPAGSSVEGQTHRKDRRR